MISHNGRFILGSQEKDEIKRAIELIPEECRFKENTIIVIVGSKVRVKWGEDIWCSNPEEDLDIIGQTAYAIIEMLKSKELWRVSSVRFLAECYPELLEEWCPDWKERLESKNR